MTVSCRYRRSAARLRRPYSSSCSARKRSYAAADSQRSMTRYESPPRPVAPQQLGAAIAVGAAEIARPLALGTVDGLEGGGAVGGHLVCEYGRERHVRWIPHARARPDSKRSRAD